MTERCAMIIFLVVFLQLGTLTNSSPSALDRETQTTNAAFQLGDVLDVLLDGVPDPSTDKHDPLRSLSLASKVTPAISHTVHHQLSSYYSPFISLLNIANNLHTKVLPSSLANAIDPASSSSSSSQTSLRKLRLSKASSSSPSSSASSYAALKQRDTDATTEDECGYGVEVGVEYHSCVCPIDWMGARCEQRRPFSCKPVLISPAPVCVDQQSANVYYGDPKCLVFSRQHDTPTFEYVLDCYFTNTTGLNSTELHPAFPYPYWTKFYSSKNTTFAITASPDIQAEWQFLVKVFNFFKPSDLSASQLLSLSPNQTAGQESVLFQLPLSQYTSDFLLGGRLYFEASVATNSSGIPPAMDSTTRLVDNRFVDFSDYKGTGRTPYTASLQGWQIVLILICSLAGFGILVKLGLYIHARVKLAKQEQRKKHQ